MDLGAFGTALVQLIPQHSVIYHLDCGHCAGHKFASARLARGDLCGQRLNALHRANFVRGHRQRQHPIFDAGG